MLKQLFENPYFYIPLVAWIIGQSIKYVVHIFFGRYDFRYLIASGGMPSVHSAVIVSLTSVAFLREGPASPLFGICIVLTGIVIYDSIGVRRASGEQAKLLNHLIEDLTTKRALGRSYGRIREFLGHKPEEVLAGSILGLAVALLFLRLNFIKTYLTPGFLFAAPETFPYLKIFLFVFGACLSLSVLAKGYIYAKGVKGAKKKLLNKVFWWAFGGGLGGILYAVFAQQGIPVVSFPFFAIMAALIWLGWAAAIVAYVVRKFKAEHDEWKEKERKEKYL